MRAFWGVGTNVGDTLTPVILEHFTNHKAEWVPSTASDKLLMCGSILEHALPGDIILGAGHYKSKQVDLAYMKVLALRGKRSGEAPVYGDPALLLPLMYKPRIKKTRYMREIPHLWDQENYRDYIDVNWPWRYFVDEILACETVVTSSLHGKIIADAYGVHAEWRHYEKIPGAKIKYEDYLSGIEGGIEQAQQGLLKAMEQL